MTGSVSHGLALATLAGAMCIQIATNFFNDAIDSKKGADTDQRLGPVRVTASGMMSAKAVVIVGGVFLLLACVAAIPLIQARGWMIVAIGLPSLFLAFGYTGGPFPLAYLGLGELFVVLFFGLVAVSGTVFVQTGEWWGSAMILGLVVGCLSAVLISINNLRDVDEDRQSNKRTLAVRWGWRKASWLVPVEVAVAAIAMTAVADQVSFVWWEVVLFAFVYAFAVYLARQVYKSRPSPFHNVLLKQAGVLLLVFGLVWQLTIFI